MEVPYVFVLRYQGMAVAEASATAHLEWEYSGHGHWYIERITLRDLDDLRDVDMIGDDLRAETLRLYRNRGFRQDAEEVARNYRSGRAYADRSLARGEASRQRLQAAAE